MISAVDLNRTTESCNCVTAGNPIPIKSYMSSSIHGHQYIYSLIYKGRKGKKKVNLDKRVKKIIVSYWQEVKIRIKGPKNELLCLEVHRYKVM
jgi:hypothetical protein